MVRPGPILMVLALAAALACTDPAEWEPKAEVRWVQWREAEAGGLAVFSVTNTGRVTLGAVEVAATLKTLQDEYRIQARCESALAPGRSAYQSVEIRYRVPGDRGSLEGWKTDSVSCR